jgi:hypothetical protein
MNPKPAAVAAGFALRAIISKRRRRERADLSAHF